MSIYFKKSVRSEQWQDSHRRSPILNKECKFSELKHNKLLYDFQCNISSN